MSTNPPGDGQQPRPPAAPPDQGQGAPSDPTALWQKEARDAYLRKAEEAATLRKELEAATARATDLDNTAKSYEQIIATMSQSNTTPAPVDPQLERFRTPLPRTGVGTPSTVEEEIDPWQPRTITRAIERVREDLRREFGAIADGAQKNLLQQMALSDMIGMQYTRISQMDPEADPARLLQHMQKIGTYDMSRAYAEVYGDKLQQKQRGAIEAELRAKIEAEMREKAEADAKARLANTPAVMGGPGRVARSVAQQPSNYRQATEQSLKEFGQDLETKE
jgi:hypothetical protein